MDAGYRPRDEAGYRTGAMDRGHSQSGMVSPMDRSMAGEWTHHTENEDGRRGPHWTMEQTDKVMAQRGIECGPAQFYAVKNMMYSDCCKVFHKRGVGDKIDFYADMARAFLEGKDAMTDKLARYFQAVVRH